VVNAEQLALRDAIRTLLARTPPEEVWHRLCAEVGVAGLAVPTEYGGAGAGLPELCVVMEELGRTLADTPMLGSAVLAATALLGSGDADECERLLPGIAEGTTTAALVWAGRDGRWDPASPACVERDGGLSGEAHYVLDGAVADVLLVAARTTDGVGLFEVDPADVRRPATTTMDLTRPLAKVTLDSVPGRRIGVAALSHVRDVALVALSAEQVGAAARCLELTVAHTTQRVQFGRPIAAFQALAHRMADLHVAVETARSAAWAAARAASDELPLLAGVAKTHCSEAFCKVAGEMIQLHGGIAITWEHDAHRYFKRAHGSAQLFGQPSEHVRRLAAVSGYAG
jgi:alkylation response protein AidB-like acyl-CoA dehydrogenase